MARVQQAVDILTSVSLDEPVAGFVRQFVATWMQVQDVVNRKIASGDVSGALNTLIWSWQQLAHIIGHLRPAVIAGRFGAEFFNELGDISNKIKDTLDDLFWWAVGIGGGLLVVTAALGYWLHKQGRLMPLIDKATNTIPQVRAAKIAAKGLGSGPTECRFGVSKTKTGMFQFDLFPVTEDGWEQALNSARKHKSSVLLSCPDGAIRMVKCGSTTCVPARH